MATFESIINEGDFVAEHFLTSDGKASFASSVTARVKAWREAEESPLTRFAAARGDLEKLFVRLGENPEDRDAAVATREALLHALGYRGQGYALAESGPVLRVASPGLGSAAPLAIVDARPADAIEDLRDKSRLGLWEPFELADGTESSSLPTFVSGLFAEDDGPAFVVVLAGRWVLLAEKTRWAEGRFLAVDLQLVAERNDAKRGGEIETALTILAADSLAPDAEGDVWWQGVIEESVKHTVGVSKDLREGVRLSIEIIANDVVRRRAAMGIDPLPQSEAQPLAIQSLRYLYRILFLLYAEASPELGVLPAGAQEYDAGYSLDRLRELVLGDITSEDAAVKTHLYDSLAVLFALVDRGHRPEGRPTEDQNDALTFNSLSADLFQPRAIAHIGDTKLSDAALKVVLERLLLSKKEGKRQRGFISYAELGINQLGAVYEGLMSYTGFFAETDLYEVAKGGDNAKGSWVVPTGRAGGIAAEDFVKAEDPVTGEMKPVLHKAGTFVYRLAGRERQQSASFYTPEVLTRFTVRQALEELLDQNGTTTTAEEVLALTVCEPALGSGAFAIEAARQLADEYLRRRQNETGETIPPEDYQRELQKVKAYIALHNVYGVDLNGTAVELAEISLWLDTMVAGLEAPWFGLHLQRGNSLIGARRAVYTRDAVNSRAWLTTPPTDLSVAEMMQNAADGVVAGEVSGKIFHFLLPAEGWGAAADAKEAKTLAPEATAKLKEWRKAIRHKPTKKQLDDLQELTYRVEALWQMAAKRLTVANEQARRNLEVWGLEPLNSTAVVTRGQIEEFLADEDSAYRRLRTVMDAWCALWFWPIEAEVDPPTLDKWIAACFDLLGRAPEARSRSRLSTTTLSSSDGWDELGEAERTDLGLAMAISTTAARSRHPWLNVSAARSKDQGFFHWQLMFPQVFGNGGFDLQVGNPPWVRPRTDVDALMAEGNPWWQLANKPSETERTEMREATLAIDGIRELVIEGTSDVASAAEYLGSAINYPVLVGLQPDLYRCFMWQTWEHNSERGAIALIHPETHFTDQKAGQLRAQSYRRLRRHWQFSNVLGLFEEIDSKLLYGIHVYGTPQVAPRFLNANYIYHPTTVERSLSHDGSGTEPGLKDDGGDWDLRPHAARIVAVKASTIEMWHRMLETGDVSCLESRMLYTVNSATASVLETLATAPRVGALGLEFSAGWHEKNDRVKGYFTQKWGTRSNWSETIIQGPHLHVSSPAYKQPNPTMRNNQDWTPVDLEAIAGTYAPATSYERVADEDSYEANYDHWMRGGQRVSARSEYRLAWRAMGQTQNERTLIPAVIPPGTTHPNGVFSASFGGDLHALMVAAASTSSLLADFAVRAAPKSGIYKDVLERTPLPASTSLRPKLALRALRLNCVSSAFSELWSAVFDERFIFDHWAADPRRASATQLGTSEREWTPSVPLRVAEDRRLAQLEIDALVALGLGVTADELCTVYRTQFAVLRKYDQENHYDANGRLVPNEVLKLYKAKGENLTEEERTATHPGSGIDYTYEFPFVVLDREADMRAAYAKFEEEFGSPA